MPNGNTKKKTVIKNRIHSLTGYFAQKCTEVKKKSKHRKNSVVSISFFLSFFLYKTKLCLNLEISEN